MGGGEEGGNKKSKEPVSCTDVSEKPGDNRARETNSIVADEKRKLNE